MAAYLFFDVEKVQAPRVYRKRIDQLGRFTDAETVSRYRLSKEEIRRLVRVLEPALVRSTNRSHALTPTQQVLVALRFLATGSFQSVVGDIHGVSQPSASRAIRAVVEAICASDDHSLSVHFPSEQAEVRRTQNEFHSIAGFPRVLGCVDGTMIAIKSPTADVENAYVCRKGFHAINVQAICNAQLIFTDVVCRWPGSTHDSFIFTNSGIGQHFEGMDAEDIPGFLLGDSGYPLRPYLMTPKANPLTGPETRYNRAHISTRNSIERALGVLKSRWRCLDRSGGSLQYSPDVASNIIMACFRLHNLCIRAGLPLPGDVQQLEPDELLPLLGNDRPDGFRAREQLIMHKFS
ncbi:putative nuclease HARBI1 [Lingula anatina]|uniref:Putative nuclease HARBI1 n=1 Tax=Lingula anatina TaxID=7574 RepID=A0A1S3IHJ1_LINAN|nr:putative nuclease HARBI1 [Lingula anatina]|eukprot:XP_013397341.1 putative nuclease HARBI1 [Lingula anatina]